MGSWIRTSKNHHFLQQDRSLLRRYRLLRPLTSLRAGFRGTAQGGCRHIRVALRCVLRGKGRARPPHSQSASVCPRSACGRLQVHEHERVGRRTHGSAAERLPPLFACGCRVTSGSGGPPVSYTIRNSSPIPVGRNLLAWDCKVTPAGCGCQEGNTIGCIPSNDGLDAGSGAGFPQRSRFQSF